MFVAAYLAFFFYSQRAKFSSLLSYANNLHFSIFRDKIMTAGKYVMRFIPHKNYHTKSDKFA